MTVTNVGAASLSGFVVDDPTIPSPLAPAPPASLLPGQSFIMTGTVTVPMVSPPASISNTVTVTATDGTNNYSDSDSATVAVLENPDARLTLTKSVAPQHAQPGDTVTYTFTIRNISGDTVPAGAFLIDITDPLMVPPSGAVELPALMPSEVVSYSFPWTVPANETRTSITNTAQLFTFDTGLDVIEDTAEAVLFIDLLSLTKTASPTTAAPGDTITYTFAITNNSTQPISTVTLADPLIDAGSWLPSNPTTSFSVAGGATVEYTGTAVIPAGYALPTFDNTAVLRIGTELAAEASARVVVGVTPPDLSLSKTAMYRRSAQRPDLPTRSHTRSPSQTTVRGTVN